jgi:hypothetical protein
MDGEEGGGALWSQRLYAGVGALAAVLALVLAIWAEPFRPSAQLVVGCLLVGIAIGAAASWAVYVRGSRGVTSAWLALILPAMALLCGAALLIKPYMVQSPSDGSRPGDVVAAHSPPAPSPRPTAQPSISPSAPTTAAPSGTTIVPGVTAMVTKIYGDGLANDIIVFQIHNGSTDPFSMSYNPASDVIVDDGGNPYRVAPSLSDSATNITMQPGSTIEKQIVMAQGNALPKTVRAVVVTITVATPARTLTVPIPYALNCNVDFRIGYCT